jgi:hypothetical protein
LILDWSIRDSYRTVMVMISDVNCLPFPLMDPFESCRILRRAWSLNDRFDEAAAFLARSREAIER